MDRIWKMSCFTIAVLGIVLLLPGCSKNTIIIEKGEVDPPVNPSGGKALVTFDASVEGRNMLTRTLSPMQKGIQNRLYAFNITTNNVRDTPSAEGLYLTSAPGVLVGSDGYKMYLDEGVYDFYAVSDNFSTIPPKFVSGQSEPLFNGIDYLWWYSPERDITSGQISIPIVYLHAATQVVFEVSAGEGITLNKLLFATITPSEPGASMELATGIIPSANAYEAADKMGVNGFIAQYIMLPVKTNTPMTLTLDVMVNGESASRTYTVSVPLPNGELKAGDSYLYSAILDGNSVTFPQVFIKNWTEVDETGKPLYPSSK